jgi:pimeloyl-ACP methyl ester carboxylesterase
MQDVMGPLPGMSGAPRVEWAEERVFGELRYRKLRYEAEPGDLVPAWLLTRRDLRRRAPAVICLHQTTRPGKDEPAGLAGKPNLHYARELALRGFVTLAPDYPNFGEYSLDVYARGYVSATMKGIHNHRRAFDVLTALPEVKRDRLGACGHSLGGHNALFLAAFDDRVRAAVTSCGFTSFRRYMKGDLTGWSHRGYMPRIAEAYGKDPARMPFDFPGVLAAIAPRAVFINAPLHDTNFDVTGVRECVERAAPFFPPKRIVAGYPEAGHDFPPEVRLDAWRFLERHLG